GRRRGRRLPGAADVGEEARPRAGALVEHLVPAVAVDPDGGRVEEDRGPARELGDGAREEARRAGPALEDRGLARVGPATPGDVLAREVHDDVDPVERARVELSAGRVPRGVPGAAGRAPDEAHDLVAVRDQRVDEGL